MCVRDEVGGYGGVDGGRGGRGGGRRPGEGGLEVRSGEGEDGVRVGVGGESTASDRRCYETQWQMAAAAMHSEIRIWRRYRGSKGTHTPSDS